jgi:hypothetical protein
VTRVPRPFYEERTVFKKGCWENWIPTCKAKVGLLPNNMYKINSKWIKDEKLLNVKQCKA